MKILIVSTYFPPKNAIASLRPYSWAKWMARYGHEVTVLTTTKEEISGDNIFPFEVVQIKVPIISYLKKMIKGIQENTSNTKISWVSRVKNIYTKVADSYGFNTVRFPDYHELWVIVSKKYLSTGSRKWDVVITTAGPYCVHRIGLFCKRKKIAKKWIVDWRDLFVDNIFFKGFFLFRPYERYLERLFNDSADVITTVSEPLCDDIQASTQTPSKIIYNGFDIEDFSSIKETERKNNDIFTIVYTGSIYNGFSNPEPLFMALSNVRKRKDIKVKIVFAGPKNADITDLAHKYKVEDCFSYVGMISRPDALKLQYDADAVLFLTHEAPNTKGVLTGKLFEYLYISREIWAIGITETSSAGAIIADANAGICFGYDVGKIESYLEQCIDDFKYRIPNRNIRNISKFERSFQTKQLIDIIDNLFN